MAVLPRCQRVSAHAADTHLGNPGGTFFACKASLCVCTVSVVPLCGHFVPKVGPKTPQGGQKVQKGAQKLTFRSPERHLWVPNWREWLLVKNQAGAMFSSHYEGPGPSLFAPKSDSGTHCAPECSFSHFCVHFGSPNVPKGAPREPQGSPKEPKGAPKPPEGRLKTIQKSTWDPTWAPKGAREAPGVPPGGKMTPKSTKKRYFRTAPGREKNRESDALPIA